MLRPLLPQILPWTLRSGPTSETWQALGPCRLLVHSGRLAGRQVWDATLAEGCVVCSSFRQRRLLLSHCVLSKFCLPWYSWLWHAPVLKPQQHIPTARQLLCRVTSALWDITGIPQLFFNVRIHPVVSPGFLLNQEECKALPAYPEAYLCSRPISSLMQVCIS